MRQNVEQVTDFFYAGDSFEQWRKHIVQAIPVTAEPAQMMSTTTGSSTTINYEITEFNPKRNITILLADTGPFKKANWNIEFAASGTGTIITCGVYFNLRFPYGFLYPLFYFNKNKLSHKLKYMEKALDEYYIDYLMKTVKNRSVCNSAQTAHQP